MLETGSGSGAMSLFLSRAGENLALDNTVFIYFLITSWSFFCLDTYGSRGPYYSAHESFAAVHI